MKHIAGTSIAAALLLLILGGCDAANDAQPIEADTAAIEQQLRENEAKWNRAYAEHDAKALAGMYAEDAALANPGTPLVSGGDAITRETAAFAADPNLQVKFQSDRIQVAGSGDLAYTRGRYTLTMTDPASKQASDSSGNYLTVWKKQADGSWKAIEDFVVVGLPPPAQ